MELDQAAALRRVAIVLSSLPEAIATRLLGELSSDQQHAVQTAVRTLADIDPLERRRALDAFAASMRRGQAASTGENDAAEIVLSQVARQHSAAAPGTRPPALRATGTTAAGAPPPLDFLRHVDDDRLAEQVCDEHPQTIAIILASITPAQAARILPKFTAEIRAETMRRLAKLQPPEPEVIAEISSQLQSKLLVAGAAASPQTLPRYQGTTAQTPIGQAALRAILAEMPAAADHPLRRDPTVDAAEPPSAAGTARHAAVADGSSSGSLDRNWSSTATSSPLVAPRIVPGSAARSPTAHDDPIATHQPAGGAAPPPPGSAATTGLSAEAVDAQLIALPAEQLRAALASVPTRQSLLALCGLPRFTADQVLTALPRRQARQIRQQINALGTLELREIDRAKALVAQAAWQIDQGSGHSADVARSRPTSSPESNFRRGTPPPQFADAA